MEGGASNDAATTTACEAGPPSDIYATAQPFECNESLHVIATRPQVTLSYDLVVPVGAAPPTAIVILLPGGDGVLTLSDAGIGTAADNFCVRTREAYAANGFVVAVPDVPSDRTDGGLDGFRATPEHATDLGDLIQTLRGAYPGLPVWLVSTSRGTISATDAVARLDPSKGPDHVVLTSSVTVIPKDAADQEDIQSVPDWQSRLAALVPILMLDDTLDACGASPPTTAPDGGGAETLAAAIGDSSHFLLIDGGPTPPPSSDPSAVCGGLAYHGFYGNDELVVEQTIVPVILGK
jgi:hypothetical protein